MQLHKTCKLCNFGKAYKPNTRLHSSLFSSSFVEFPHNCNNMAPKSSANPDVLKAFGKLFDKCVLLPLDQCKHALSRDIILALVGMETDNDPMALASFNGRSRVITPFKKRFDYITEDDENLKFGANWLADPKNGKFSSKGFLGVHLTPYGLEQAKKLHTTLGDYPGTGGFMNKARGAPSTPPPAKRMRTALQQNHQDVMSQLTEVKKFVVAQVVGLRKGLDGVAAAVDVLRKEVDGMGEKLVKLDGVAAAVEGLRKEVDGMDGKWEKLDKLDDKLDELDMKVVACNMDIEAMVAGGNGVAPVGNGDVIGELTDMVNEAMMA